MPGKKKGEVVVRWNTSMYPSVLAMLRKRSDKTGASMAELMRRLILRAEKEGWA